MKKMTENIHTHTALCHHAVGTVREYAEAAAARGLRVLGFADHSPQFMPEGIVSGMRMLPEQLPGYVRELTELRREYEGRLDIRIGLELEYYPDSFDEILSWIRECGVEYLILGQHWLVGREKGEAHAFAPTTDEGRLKQYVDQMLEGLKTGVFTYVAHPDAFGFTGDEAVYRRHMERFCRGARELDVPLEINLQGLMENRAYPTDRFWRIAAETGNRVVFGLDAHQPHVVANEKPYQDGLLYCERLGIVPEEHFVLRDIR